MSWQVQMRAPGFGKLSLLLVALTFAPAASTGQGAELNARDIATADREVVSDCAAAECSILAGLGPFPSFGDMVRAITFDTSELINATKGIYRPLGAVVLLLAFILWRIW